MGLGTVLLILVLPVAVMWNPSGTALHRHIGGDHLSVRSPAAVDIEFPSTIRIFQLDGPAFAHSALDESNPL